MFSAVAKHCEHLAKSHCLDRGPEGKIGEFVVGLFEVLDERLAATLSVFMEVVYEALVFEAGDPRKSMNIQVREWSITMSKLIGQACADGDLDSLNRVHYQEVKLSIKSVAAPNGL